MVNRDVADWLRIPARLAIKSPTMPIFGPRRELTNEAPGPPPVPPGPPVPPAPPNRLPRDPKLGISRVIILKRPVAPLGDEASAAAEPSSAGVACSSADLVPSGLS